ncbi:MAG: hypothetical protein CSA15_12350 [Candidatus Delongbacteria bacterium]|nr:MAG: hypothetical protein CSA15_12350 [Candidatus Delongbacteria bacterium]
MTKIEDRKHFEIRNLDLSPLIIILSIIVLYYVPFEFSYLIIYIIPFLYFILISILTTGFGIDKSQFILYSLLIAFSFITRDQAHFLIAFFLLFISMLTNRISCLGTFSKYFVAFLISFRIFYAIIFYYSSVSFRLLLNNPDPNFSSLKILFGVYLLHKLKFYISIPMLLFAGFLTASRNFVLAMLVFYISMLITNIFKLNFKKSKLFKYHYLLIVSFVLVIIISISFIGMGSVSISSSASSTERLTSVNDTSNLLRFTTNLFYLKEVFTKISVFFWGLGDNYETFAANSVVTIVPHNSIISILSRTGVIFSLIYFTLLSKTINRFFNYYNLPYILSYTVFGMFLHQTLEFHNVVIFILILSILPNESKTKL